MYPKLFCFYVNDIFYGTLFGTFAAFVSNEIFATSFMAFSPTHSAAW